MAGNLISSILGVVLLIGVGYIAKRAGLLSMDDRRVINSVIIYLAMPALIFRSVVQSKIDISFLKIPALAIAVMTLSLAVAFAVGKLMKLDKSTMGAFMLVATVGNTGYLGYPLTVSLFGQEGLVRAVFFDIFGSVLFVFTIGLIIAQRYGNGEAPGIARELLTFPPLIGLIAALFLRGVVLPGFISKAVDFTAGATIPLIMLSIGLSIEMGHLLEHRSHLALTALIKLVLAPLVALAGAIVLGFNPADTGVSILEASMPSMMISLVIGLKYGLDVEFLPVAIVGTTLISLVTIPVWQLLVSLITSAAA